MPTYEYETLPSDGRPPVRFEIQQRMADPPLETHPETGEPVQRVMSAPFVATGARATASACNITRCGMGGCGMGACGDE